MADKLKAAGFDEAMLYQRKLYGITDMEKLVGKKKLAATLGDLLIKPAGKPVLVPESDNTSQTRSYDSRRGGMWFERMKTAHRTQILKLANGK